jgi:hypothetical protein
MLGRLFTPLCLLGLLSVPSVAQSQNDASAPSPPPTATPAPTSSPTPTPPKKVWTNDDLPSSKGSQADKKNANFRTTPTQNVDPATVDRIRKSLEKLQTQLDEVNKKLKSYKEFQSGEPVSTDARELNKGISRTPVDQQLTQLEDKKKQLETQISDLNDEARKKGIDPGQLR